MPTLVEPQASYLRRAAARQHGLALGQHAQANLTSHRTGASARGWCRRRSAGQRRKRWSGVGRVAITAGQREAARAARACTCRRRRSWKKRAGGNQSVRGPGERTSERAEQTHDPPGQWSVLAQSSRVTTSRKRAGWLRGTAATADEARTERPRTSEAALASIMAEGSGRDEGSGGREGQGRGWDEEPPSLLLLRASLLCPSRASQGTPGLHLRSRRYVRRLASQPRRAAERRSARRTCPW